MICKSYLIEENIELLKNNINLFYGENIGLLDAFKKVILIKNKNCSILKFTQEEILKNENNFFNEIQNLSLFENKKIFIIQNVNDKILKIINKIYNKEVNNKFYLFSGILEKKSKLRNFFENQNKIDIIPCYPDNEITLKKLILNNLKNYSGVSPSVINAIIDCCSSDRAKINNEIEKIKTYFQNKSIDINDLNKLLNFKEDGDINLIKDSALSGNKKKTNKLLQSMIIESEKIVYYIAAINDRLSKLKAVKKINSDNIDKTINEMKPPIFWKDKPKFVEQSKLWNIKKLNFAVNIAYKAELSIKSRSDIDKKLIIKKLIIDICNLATAA